ncbi:MAG: DUF3783 domain-containing protein [Ruminococcus sp.]|nr:DUF3783 domain-containing protein [Ruminococcus sp.]
MRARIVNSGKPSGRIIMIYGFDGGTQEVFRSCCADTGAELRVIDSGRAGERIGFLAEFGGFSSNGTEVSREGRCVIFSGFDSKGLDKALASMRKNGLGGIPLKAVVTEHNQSMTLSELMDELEREHIRMTGNRP